MSDTEVIEICRTSIVVAIYVMGPILVLMMVVGTVLSVLQTITSIQEQTLAMVPKTIAVFGSSILLMPYMIGELDAFFQTEIIDRIVQMGAPAG